MGKYTVKKTESGYHFNLKVDNDEIIGKSEVYNTKTACMNGIESVKKNGPVAKVEDQTVADYKKVTNPKYIVAQDKAGKFRFNLTATNGQVILSSQAYKELPGCMNGIASVQKNSGDSEIAEEE